MENCINAVYSWMTCHKLCLNPSKTVLLVLHKNPAQIPTILLNINNTIIHQQDSARNLGFQIANNLSIDYQISNTVKSSFLWLKRISALKRYLPEPTLVNLIHASITSRLDFCNSLYINIPHNQLYRLQKLQNSAARLLTGTPGRNHISPVLAKLHWLPIKKRILFKILSLTHRSV